MLYEVTNVFVIQGLEADTIAANLAKLQGLIDSGIIILIPPTVALLEKAAALAATETHGQGHISSYDATFHALALDRGGILITADKKHVLKTQNVFGSVEELSSFSRYGK